MNEERKTRALGALLTGASFGLVLVYALAG